MKKAFIFLGLMSLIAFNSKATTFRYDCNQKNTKPWGCYDSRETTLDNTYYLVCWDPGEKICEFKDHQCPMISWQDATNLVYSKVESGILQGTVDLQNGVTITWDAESTENYHYVITEQ